MDPNLRSMKAGDVSQNFYPRGSTYTTIMNLRPKRPSLLWFCGLSSADPLGIVGSLLMECRAAG